MSLPGGSPYRFVKELASGGMGRIDIVVRREGAFARPYARKRLLKEFADDPEVRAMFLEEARVAGLVRHANVVGVLDVGEDADGPYLVMDLVDGVSLFEVLHSFRSKLPIQVAVEIGRQVAEGLHAAHELVAPDGRAMELVHRDVSLTNVLCGFDGVVRVVDFGVARAVDRGSLTRIGTLKGRLSYMAAEQLEHRGLDRRADLYALGVVLAELLRGARLHGSASPEEVARRTLEEPPPDLGEHRDDVPAELTELLFELLARDRAARPATARDVAQRLLAIATTLRAEEGPIDLGELLRARFADVRQENAAVLAAALDDREGTEIEPSPAPVPRTAPKARPIDLHEQQTVVRAAPPARGPVVRADRTTFDRPWQLLGAATLLLALGGLVLLWVTTDDAPANLDAAGTDLGVTPNRAGAAADRSGFGLRGHETDMIPAERLLLAPVGEERAALEAAVAEEAIESSDEERVPAEAPEVAGPAAAGSETPTDESARAEPAAAGRPRPRAVPRHPPATGDERPGVSTWAWE